MGTIILKASIYLMSLYENVSVFCVAIFLLEYYEIVILSSDFKFSPK